MYPAASREGDLKATGQLVDATGPRTGAWYHEPIPQKTHAIIYHPAALKAFRAVFKPRAVRSRQAVLKRHRVAAGRLFLYSVQLGQLVELIAEEGE